MPVRIFALLFILPAWVYSQSPKVPSRMEFAGIKLRLTEGARADIQKDVDALTRSPKYFNIKVERAKTYFPFIEKAFREEGLHEDFKYLVLQESALIPDAVSSSDAVGFWQFKDFTALEVGLRVDNHIDERMNIVSSSRGAARYMKKNNQYFDNWLHALQAYQMGPGGAMRVLGDKYKGASSMVIDENTYWYVKKFLAHMVAFQDALDGPGETKLIKYKEGKNRSLKEISKETGISLQQLQDYNKWLKKGKVPGDKEYALLLPVSKLDNINLASLETGKRIESSRTLEYKFPGTDKFPEIEDPEAAANGEIVEINQRPGIIAKAGDEIALLARKGGVDLSKFLKYNDLDINTDIKPGQVYYYKRKRAKAQAHFYVARPDESLWSISQKFGIRLKKLKGKNRIRDDKGIKPGRVLWLRFIRPERIPIEYRSVPQLEEKPVMVANNADTAVDLVEDFKPTVDKEPVDATAGKGAVTREDTVSVALMPDEEVSTAVEEVEEIEAVDHDHTTTTDDSANIRKIHVVEAGETLYRISKMYQVTVRDLLNWNELSISDGINIGQRLIIFDVPEDKNNPAQDDALYTYHTVSQGETLYKIARSYDVTIEQLMTWNDKEDFNVNLGERLKIKQRKE